MYTPLLAQTLYDEDTLSDFVLAQARQHSLTQTCAALPLARKCHEGQYRKGATPIPYITHPLATACHALALGLAEDDLIAALLLHDVIEDAGMTADELPISPAAAEAVRLVSKTPGYIEEEYYAAISKNPLACLVKRFDRCHNIACMASGFPKRKMEAYIEETNAYILPLFAAAQSMRPELSPALWQMRYQLLTTMDTIARLL